MRCITAKHVIAIHEHVIQNNELQGMAHNSSVKAVVGRIENRLRYGLISDVYELAACYACFIAVGHFFLDANKRTAHTSMQVVLKLNSIRLQYETEELGDMIVKAARSEVDELELAEYLRSLPLEPAD